MLEILGLLFLYALVMGWINPSRGIDEKKEKAIAKQTEESKKNVNRDLFFRL